MLLNKLPTHREQQESEYEDERYQPSAMKSKVKEMAQSQIKSLQGVGTLGHLGLAIYSHQIDEIGRQIEHVVIQSKDGKRNTSNPKRL